MNLLKNRNKLKWALKMGLGLTVIGGSTIFFYEKELRKHPIQIFKGLVRTGRMSVCGLKMISAYYSPFNSELSMSEKHELAAEHLKKTFIKNSGTYIKVGQVLACMEVLLPIEYCNVLSEMFQNAPRTDYKDIKRIIEKELNKPLEHVFSYFEEEPISSASIAQVHKARLRSNGELVAVKVQHPWLSETVQLDIDVVSVGIRIGNALFKDFNYNWIIDDMNTNLPKELNFHNEAKNCMKIKKLLPDNKIKIPYVHLSHSTKKLMIMEFVDGYSITDTERLKKDGIDISEVAKRVSNVFNKMIFEKGFVHADPHPGNIFVNPTRNGDFKVILLDHGLYRDLSDKTKISYSKLWSGIILQDKELILEACHDFGVGKEYRLFASMITNQKYDRIMDKGEKNIKDRLQGRNLDKNEKLQENRDLALHYRRQILWCLEKMNRELILIFKVNDYLNNIDSKLGKPVNNYYYVANYALKNYSNSHSFPSIFSRLYFKWLSFKTLFMIRVYEMYLRLTYNMNWK